ncbi:MAG: anti-sigma factor antagonist [Chitinivibrionales bacterium]|nr:anti-sigma factor antagonist [Chitinivibrionales bacterium]
MDGPLLYEYLSMNFPAGSCGKGGIMAVDKDGDITSVCAPENLSGSHVKEMKAAISEAMDEHNDRIVIDLKKTVFIDSSGIGALVSLAKELKSRGEQLSLRNVQGDIRELFEETGLDKIFALADNSSDLTPEVDIFEESVDIKLEIDQKTLNNVCIFHLKGVMNHPRGSRYFKQRFLLAMENHNRILLDFDDLTFFDSLSVSVILNMNKLIKDTGGKLRVSGTNYIVNDLFSTLSIDKIIPFYKSARDALEEWE